MFLYVVAIKVIIRFNNDGKGIKVYRQVTQKIKIENIFWNDINCFASLKPILIYETSRSKINFSKNPGIITY